MPDTMFSHYVPYFTTSRYPTAVCGLSQRFVTFEHSAEPTCPVCKAWLEAPADELKQQDADRQTAEQAVGR